MSGLHIVDHPLIRHKMGILRNKETKTKDFREIINEISTLVCYEATKNLRLCPGGTIETPICQTEIEIIADEVVLVPILRAGLGMVSGILNLIPTAIVGHVGFYRDPVTLNPVEYLCKLPGNLENKTCLILDPMLATGGTASAAVGFLKEKGANSIKLLSVIACPEGVKALSKAHPDIEIYSAVMDERLNDHAYIVPGLGDAGDRIFGTI